MNIKNKIAAFCTLSALTLSITGQSFAAAGTFTDLKNISQSDKIISLRQNGYITGTGNSKFSPVQKLTVAEGIQFIVNSFKLNIDNIRFIKAPKATDYFKNADNNAWYAKTFIIASLNGLALPKDLDPKAEWTREAFTYYLISAMEKHGELPMIKIAPAVISDEDQLTIGYQGAIQRSLAYGVAKLTDDNKFNPKSKITRAEAAEEVYNAVEYLKAHPAPNAKLD